MKLNKVNRTPGRPQYISDCGEIRVKLTFYRSRPEFAVYKKGKFIGRAKELKGVERVVDKWKN